MGTIRYYNIFSLGFISKRKISPLFSAVFVRIMTIMRTIFFNIFYTHRLVVSNSFSLISEHSTSKLFYCSVEFIFLFCPSFHYKRAHAQTQRALPKQGKWMKIIVPFRNPCLAVTVEATRHTAGYTPHGMHDARREP